MDLEGVVFADRSERGKLRFTGDQRAWFLDQILTQSFDPLLPGEVREAALLTPHGRMVGYLEAVATDDAILVHFERELLDSFPDSIRRYVFATLVDIADVTDERGLVLVAGTGWEDVAATASGPVQTTSAIGASGAYVWVAREELAGTIDAFRGAGARLASEEELEGIRIANGVARWGRDMNEKSIPQEARIEDVAVHFNKGCYVGQEAMAKIHFRGRVNKLLRQIAPNEPVSPGADVVWEGASVGKVTSSSGARALAMLKRTVSPGTVVTVGTVEAKVVA
jgi:folate-binding protein YgfZ